MTPAGHASDCCEPWCGADASCDCGAGVGAGAGAAPDPCATSHKELFYANDFSYLKDRSYQGSCLGDRLKLMPVAGGDWGPLDIGGQWRLRYHGEQGMGREITAVSQDRFQDTNNDFLLSRLRLYTNWKLNDKARIFVEGILANATDDGGDYFSRGIDYNRGDFLNLLIDLKLTDSLTARVLYKEGDWAVDVFFTYFVPPIFDELDEADSDQPFYGSWGTYSGFETYYLGYENNNVGATNGTADFSLHTLGLRLSGRKYTNPDCRYRFHVL